MFCLQLLIVLVACICKISSQNCPNYGEPHPDCPITFLLPHMQNGCGTTPKEIEDKDEPIPFEEANVLVYPNGNATFDTTSVFLNWTTLSPYFCPTYITFKNSTLNDAELRSIDENARNGQKVFRHFRYNLQLFLNARFAVCCNITKIVYVTWWNNTDQEEIFQVVLMNNGGRDIYMLILYHSAYCSNSTERLGISLTAEDRTTHTAMKRVTSNTEAALFHIENGNINQKEAIDCGRPCPPTNGKVYFSSTTGGSKAVQTCNGGLNHSSQSVTMNCTSGGWSEPPLICPDMECGTQMSNILDDLYEGNESLVLNWCDFDYDVDGNATVRCKCCGSVNSTSVTDVEILHDDSMCSVSKWFMETTMPECSPVAEERCRNLTSPGNGTVMTNGTFQWAVANYSCELGFQLVGDAVRQCQYDENGELMWSATAPSCVAEMCENLPSPANGTVMTNGTLQWATAVYSCDPGYILTGDEERQCLYNDGSTLTWSGRAPRCDKDLCNDDGKGIRFDDNGDTIEVCYKGEWRSVCDDYWTDHDAKVACEQLGFSKSNFSAKATKRGVFEREFYKNANKSRLYWLDDVQCTGDEKSLFECEHRKEIGTHNCGRKERAGVKCIETEIRFVDGSDEIIEVRYGSEWRSVCINHWTLNDVEVACRQLGIGTDGSHTTVLEREEKGEKYWLDFVNCHGDEESLFACHHLGLGEHKCDNGERAGVKCHN